MPNRLASAPSPKAIRDELMECVRKDLLGPACGPEEEVAEPRVRDRYLVGMLAPKKQSVAAEEIDDLATGGDEDTQDGEPDPPGLKSNTMFPSSFGMTFCVDGSANALKVMARWGNY